jgi:hypothetical protein
VPVLLERKTVTVGELILTLTDLPLMASVDIESTGDDRFGPEIVRARGVRLEWGQTNTPLVVISGIEGNGA